MKRFLAIATVVILSAFAGQAQQQCDPEEITSLYKKFLEQRKGPLAEQKAASESARTYLAKFGECPGEAEIKITKFLKQWQTEHETAVAHSNCATAVDKTPARAIEQCRRYLAKDTSSLRAHLLISLVGIRNSQSTDETLKVDALKSMKKALELISAGNTTDPWIFGGSKEETVAALEFYSASFTMDTDPTAAAATMLRLAHSSSSYRKDPNTYYYLARSLHDHDVQKQLAEYNKKCSAQAGTPECEAFNDRIEAMIDRAIDAYARAVALAADKPEHTQVTAIAKPKLVELYRQRHGSEAGLDKLIADVLSKDMPK